ncbi:MAG: hypothetical protein Tsb009_20350 [Planctomycetaceae bacterium]
MKRKTVHALVMLLFLGLLSTSCQKPDGEADQKPLSKTEAAKYRQVTIKVTGLT